MIHIGTGSVLRRFSSEFINLKCMGYPLHYKTKFFLSIIENQLGDKVDINDADH
jgi:hypothetical protein